MNQCVANLIWTCFFFLSVTTWVYMLICHLKGCLDPETVMWHQTDKWLPLCVQNFNQTPARLTTKSDVYLSSWQWFSTLNIWQTQITKTWNTQINEKQNTLMTRHSRPTNTTEVQHTNGNKCNNTVIEWTLIMNTLINT